MGRYFLKFDPDAFREWKKLDNSIQSELQKLLKKRLANPVVASARLHGEMHHCFKIKSKKSGYRLIYTIIENEVTVLVIAIGNRDKLAVYKAAYNRFTTY